MTLSFKLTDTIIVKLNDLHNQFSHYYASLKTFTQDERDALHHYARISMIGSSTRIENALLTDPEIHWMDTVLTVDGKPEPYTNHDTLIQDKLSKDRERSIEEVAGCREMLFLIYDAAQTLSPLREGDVRHLHHTLLSPYKKVHHIAGKYKEVSNSVVENNKTTGATRVVFSTADPGPITSAAMAELVGWYNETIQISPWPVAVASEFVYRFLAIHPFQDGNGRLGRGLFLMTLLSCPMEVIRYVAPFLSIDRFIEKHKEEYYSVLNRCSDGQFSQDPQQYHVEHFLNFMVKVLEESLCTLDALRKRFKAEKELSDSAQKVLLCFRGNPERRLTTSEVIALTKLERRTVIRSFNTLLEAHLIQKYGKGTSTRYQITF